MSSSLFHYGVKGMRWGVRNSKKDNRSSDVKTKKETKHQIRKENRRTIKEKYKDMAKQKIQRNRERILREMEEYEKKTGEDYVTKFLEVHDDLELWDLYSPEELKVW